MNKESNTMIGKTFWIADPDQMPEKPNFENKYKLLNPPKKTWFDKIFGGYDKKLYKNYNHYSQYIIENEFHLIEVVVFDNFPKHDAYFVFVPAKDELEKRVYIKYPSEFIFLEIN